MTLGKRKEAIEARAAYVALDYITLAVDRLYNEHSMRVMSDHDGDVWVQILAFRDAMAQAHIKANYHNGVSKYVDTPPPSREVK